MSTTYCAEDGSRFQPMPGRVLIAPDEGPESIGSVLLPDSARRFEGFRSGRVVATGDPTKTDPDMPEVGTYVHYNRNAPPPKMDEGVQIGREVLILLWGEQVLCEEVGA